MGRSHHHQERHEDKDLNNDCPPPHYTVDQFQAELDKMSPKELRARMQRMGDHLNDPAPNCPENKQGKKYRVEEPKQINIPPAEYIQSNPQSLVEQQREQLPQQAPAPHEPTHTEQGYYNSHERDSDDDHFHGLDIGIVKLGYDDRKDSAVIGANIGIANAAVNVGRTMGVDAGVGVGDVGAHTGASVDVDRNGLHAGTYAGARVSELTGVNVNAKAGLGPQSGTDVDLRGYVGPEENQFNAGANVGKDGAVAYTDGYVGVPNYAGVKTGAHAELSRNSSIGADTGVQVGPSGYAGTGFSIDTNGNRTLSPGIHADGNWGPNQNRIGAGVQLGPKFDLTAGISKDSTDLSKVDQAGNYYNQGTDATIGIGQSGVGFKTTDHSNGRRFVTRRYGFGNDY